MAFIRVVNAPAAADGHRPNLPAGAMGICRLWSEDTGLGTDLHLVISDVDIGMGKTVSLKDFNTFDGKMTTVFNKARVTMKMYGASKRRSFALDIHVPQAVINAYTG